MRAANLLAAALVLIGLSDSAWAQGWFIEPSISTSVTATSNTTLGGSTDERDVLFGARPRVVVRGDTPLLHVVGRVEFDAVTYTRHTQDDVVLPEGDLLARLTVIERTFFVEGSVRAVQTSVNPFSARFGIENVDNTATSTQYRLSPYLDAEPTRGLHLRARSDYSKTNSNGVAVAVDEKSGRSYFARHTASIEQDPRPLGWRLEEESNRTRFQGESTRLNSDVARALVNYALNDTFSFGLRGGSERNNFLSSDFSGPIYGGQMAWHPTERTALNLEGEHRFFGTAWHLAFTHRSPFIAWTLTFSRDIDTTPEALFDLPPTDNVAALLDSILTTRFPNAVDRAKQVQDLIKSRGLPSSIPSLVQIIEARLSRTNTVSATAVLLGTRSSLAASVFRSEVRDLLETGPLAADDPNANNRVIGASLAYTRGLSPTVTGSLILEYTRIDALEEATVRGHSKQAAVRGEIGLRVGRKSSLRFGAEYRKLASTVVPSGNEALASIGFDHTF
jgi:uncharacterized protein (PEP-CTERM system associated)